MAKGGLPITNVKTIGLKSVKGFDPELLPKLAAKLRLFAKGFYYGDLKMVDAMVRERKMRSDRFIKMFKVVFDCGSMIPHTFLNGVA